MSKRSYKRRKLLIDKSQYKLLAIYLVHFVAVLVIVFSAFVLLFTRQLEHSSLTAFQRQEVAAKIMWFFGHMWPFMWGIFMLLVIHSIYVTHKIAGPLYRIRNVLWSVKTGDLTRKVTIRNRDYLGDEVQAVNEVIETYRKKIGDMSAIADSTGTTLASLQRAIERSSPDETRQRFDELSAQIDGLQTSLDYFTIAARKTKEDAETLREATVEDLTPVG
jgi:methyl-accepting chemotaxis protein